MYLLHRKKIDIYANISLLYFLIPRSWCSVATDLRVLYFCPTDDLQDLVCYDIKLVLIV